nr:helicase HerA-like domain-containing protein [Paracoccus saliphilus]
MSIGSAEKLMTAPRLFYASFLLWLLFEQLPKIGD